MGRVLKICTYMEHTGKTTHHMNAEGVMQKLALLTKENEYIKYMGAQMIIIWSRDS